ncbi:hypothetical protein HPB49_005717 [Dermacentor silvarum]|uniref:Uncharacterized protein n=1 Tax=Dermacentor silvarum TaxID=543639 RepID=A0ACB8D2U1_DERSI|nr:hypothetical protein HPB49_005717 [Dermacentor silvarum]
MDGFVDYGDVASRAADKIADHGLLLMFVPLFEDWVKPIASFATKGAVPGKVVSKLLLSGVLKLHKSYASVLAVISDGPGNNRSMWTCSLVYRGSWTRHAITSSSLGSLLRGSISFMMPHTS